MTCREFIVTGRVQGVFFRASTRDIATPLGITGHAINRSDGSVEVLACGGADALAALERWLAQGPRMANVETVQSRPVECDAPAGFAVG